MESKEAYNVNVDYAEGSVEDLSGISPKKLTSWQKFKKFVELDSASDGRRSNHDLDPVPPEERTWKMRHYALFWVSDNLSVSGFRNAASLMEVGMSWRLSLACIAIANIFQGIFIVINGMVGAEFHIPFSIHSRSCFGYYLSYLFICMRMVVGTFWYAIQVYTGAECVQSMLYAIWPSFHNVENHIPVKQNITTQFMIAYVIYFLTCMPFHYVGVQRLKWLFLVKSITTPIVSFAILGWVVAEVHKTGKPLTAAGSTISGSTLGWTFVAGLNSNVGSGTTLMVNAPDYARYARRPSDTFSSALAIPATGVLITVIGVFVAQGSQILFGTILWDPLEVINNWTSHGGRAAAFFCALSFYSSQLGLNIAANSLAAANDMNCLFPRYINIRRGQFITAFIGSWAMTPWNILSSASGFLNFMGGYSIWLCPIYGILVTDYFFVHKKKINVPELYNFHGPYRYYKGYNWRAFVAFTIAWVPLLPGFIPVVSGFTSANQGIAKLYKVGFWYGLFISSLSYYFLCKFFPQEETYFERGIQMDELPVQEDDEPIPVQYEEDYDSTEKK
ncbi:permease for cytosine/purines, uracil, thiamine, allantoin-domain-containing protein [Lipomyces oligophaga]|uniref:permease for cytosine/purines, uracil, thiamine, allantoin-domain-containing protein n=1 Tax=Lipomyces oligophaga TaxID=45792 RepID=UPI0034CEF861